MYQLYGELIKRCQHIVSDDLSNTDRGTQWQNERARERERKMSKTPPKNRNNINFYIVSLTNKIIYMCTKCIEHKQIVIGIRCGGVQVHYQNKTEKLR